MAIGRVHLERVMREVVLCLSGLIKHFAEMLSVWQLSVMLPIVADLYPTEACFALPIPTPKPRSTHWLHRMWRARCRFSASDLAVDTISIMLQDLLLNCVLVSVTHNGVSRRLGFGSLRSWVYYLGTAYRCRSEFSGELLKYRLSPRQFKFNLQLTIAQ